MAALRFGPFRVDPEAGILLCGLEPSPLGRRAVALLVALVEQAGSLVPKETLIRAGWPGLVVEDSNLTVQIAALRRVLEEKAGAGSWIETMPRRGYRYIGPAAVAVAAPAASDATSAPALPDMPSIAVLPFSNLGRDAADDYFADGMVDDIVTGLSRINWLFVIARQSTSTYKTRAVDVAQIGRELGVRYVLEGSVRRAPDRVRINCQLIDASTRMHIWAERFERQADDVFALQDEIAWSVVGAITPSLRKAEVDRVRRKRPDSLDAYDLVLRAQTDVDSGMPAQVSKALVLLRQAIALDPTYALAHGDAAMCHHCLFLRDGFKDADRDASIAHARMAIAHGHDDAQALTLAGFSLGMDAHDRAAAFSAMEAALAISPSSALTYILGSVIHGWAGDAERAIEWSGRGMRLSPFDPWAFAAFDAQALGYFHLGRYEDAASAAYRAVQANPAHSITHVQLSAALARLGQIEASRAAAARVLELHPTFRFSRQFAGVNCAPALAASLGDALREAGLPP